MRITSGSVLAWAGAVILTLAGSACGQYAGVHANAAPVRPVVTPLSDEGDPAGAAPATPPILVTDHQWTDRAGKTHKGLPPGTKVTYIGFAAAADGPNPFQVCPVQGPRSAWDDFGQPRYVGGFHLHQGIDITSPEGTPIVAPFAGRAIASPSSLGGNAVIVYGAAGYVYNAHLSRYGHLGEVQAGTVVGYVGQTGDASGPHDHFEWHPNAIPANPWRSSAGYTVIHGAIDPFPFLVQVCS